MSGGGEIFGRHVWCHEEDDDVDDDDELEGFLAAGAGDSGRDDISERIEDILRSELGQRDPR